VTTIDMSLKGFGRVVIFALDHFSNIHDRNIATAAMLQKLIVVNAPVVIDNICGLSIFAHHDVRRISERPTPHVSDTATSRLRSKSLEVSFRSSFGR
jgi:hypothetical protein